MATYCAKCEKKLRFIGGVGGRLEGKFICPNCQDELAEEAKHDSGLRWTEGSWRYKDDVPDRSEIHFNVSQWLRDMGLDLYETNFVDNDINGREILLMLAEHDLEKIGVHSLGHRKQMLASMDELRREISEHPEERFEVNTQRLSGGELFFIIVAAIVTAGILLFIASLIATIISSPFR